MNNKHANNSEYDGYYKQENKYGPHTVAGILDYGEDEGGYYARMHPKMLPIILEDLNTNGRFVLSRLLQLLNNKDRDRCVKLFDYAAYRYIIQSTQTQLSELLNLKQSTISKGLKDLEEHGIIIKKPGGVIVINPLVYNRDIIYDIRCLQEFGLTLKKDSKGNIIRFDKCKTKNNTQNVGSSKITRTQEKEENIRYDLSY